MIIFLKFTAAQAIAAARIINRRFPSNDPAGDNFQRDGWYSPDDASPAYYFNFDVLGRTRSTFPTGTDANGDPTYTMRTGVHVNLNWMGPEEALPPQLAPYRVYPVHPAVVFG